MKPQALFSASLILYNIFCKTDILKNSMKRMKHIAFFQQLQVHMDFGL